MEVSNWDVVHIGVNSFYFSPFFLEFYFLIPNLQMQCKRSHEYEAELKTKKPIRRKVPMLQMTGKNFLIRVNNVLKIRIYSSLSGGLLLLHFRIILVCI